MAKNRSTFLDFKYKEDKKKSEGFGLTYEKHKAKDVKKIGIEDKELKLVPYIVCPICCRNQPLNRTGTFRRNINKRSKKRDTKTGETKDFRSVVYNPNKETTFGKFDFENAPFISIRQVTGANGIIEVDIITLKQVKNMSANDKVKIIPIIEAIRNSCEKILGYTDELV